MQIKVEPTDGLYEIDKYHAQIAVALNADVDAVIDLVLPIKIEDNFVGSSVALCQLVFTWLKYPLNNDLIFDINDPESIDDDMLMGSEFLFPVIMACWYKPIISLKGGMNLKPYFREPLASIRELMVKVNTMKGWKLLLTSIDHFPPRSGLIPCYENTDGFIDNEANTFRNLSPALTKLLAYSESAKENFKQYEKDFVAIIHELVKNTHEWGKTDINGVAFDPSVRGVLVKFYKKRRATFLEEFIRHRGLTEYFNSPVLKENTNTELYFLEISVFDCGAGFFDKYESDDKGKLSEIDVIKRCLIKHMTTAKGLDKDDKGIGLDRILNVLDGKGFLKIQTSHSCLYRDLIHQPYRSVNNEADLELFDWHLHSNTQYTPLPKVSGATLTILYPLNPTR